LDAVSEEAEEVSEIVSGRYEDGHVYLTRREGDEVSISYPDSFFLLRRDVEKLPRGWEYDLEGRFARVHWPESNLNPWSRLKYHYESTFIPRKIRPLEADVDPVTRLLIERPRLRFCKDWRLLWYDLETERIEDWEAPWRSRILSFSWRSSNGRHGHVRLKAKTDGAERALLRTFCRLADRHDIILAWNGKRFDDRVVRGRCTILDVPFDPYLNHWLDHLKLFKRYFLRSEDGGATSSFALEAVSAALLGEERKVPVEEIARQRGWNGDGDLFSWIWEHTPDLLQEYNDQDVRLMELLEEKTGFIALHLALCRLCRIFPGQRSLFPSYLVDGKMFQQAWPEWHFPSRSVSEEKDFTQAKGAFVPEAVKGLHESVAVLDYTRMYPSIIRTFNLSPETIEDEGTIEVPDTDELGELTGDVVARFRARPEGNLPAALRTVLEERDQYSKRQSAAEVGSPEFHDAGRLSQACKALANSFYGVVLSPFSRYYRKEIGESVTAVGRRLLSQTKRTVEKRGHVFVFGDTDSVAFVADDEEATSVKDEINEEMIPRIVEATGADVEKSEIAIDYEKRYRRIVVTASKRYAGLFALYKGKPATDETPMDVRGLEIVRSDVCRAARDLQRKTLGLILEGEGEKAIRRLLESRRLDLIDGRISFRDLVLAKAMTKKPSEYATKPVQVRVAEKLIAEGKEVNVGDKIPFLVTPKGAVHPGENPGEIDVREYWDRYVYAATLRVLEAAFPGKRWNGLLLGKRWDPRQGELFATRQKTRRVKPRTLLLEVPESVDVVKLKRLLETFGGKIPIRVDVRVPGAVVELDAPQTVGSPIRFPLFSDGLSDLSVKWSWVAG
jgi:DNA polymerase I